MARTAVKLDRRSRSRKQQRLEARVTPDQKRLIERAAELRGTSVTAFVVDSAREAATKTISEFAMLNLQDEARELFVSMVLNPPAPNQVARTAARRYKENSGR